MYRLQRDAGSLSRRSCRRSLTSRGFQPKLAAISLRSISARMQEQQMPFTDFQIRKERIVGLLYPFERKLADVEASTSSRYQPRDWCRDRFDNRPRR
jgi:hypothetical protein